MRSIPALYIPLSLALAACGGGGGKAPGAGLGSLTAVLTVPDPAVPADPATQVVVTFNRLMDRGSIEDREGASLWFRRGGVPWTELEVPAEARDDVGQQRSQLVFAPKALLPAGADLKVVLTGKVRDREGTPLSPRELGFGTAEALGAPLVLEEGFQDQGMAEEGAGGLDWARGRPGLRPGLLGGPGLLGIFVAPAGETPIRTEESYWPANQTLTGQQSRVSNGIFFFQRLEVPAGSTLRFTGSYPARLFVAGDLVVEGRILADGGDAEPTDGGRFTPRGGEGGAGGPGGGRGGLGGGQPLFSRVRGFDGAGLAVPPGHPDEQAARACAGQGAPGHPASGLSQDLVFGGDDRCRMAAAGGGGASAFSAGQAGRVVQVPEPFAAHAGASSVPGLAFPFLPLRPTLAAELQFLFGGAGGGGGGAHPFLHLRDPQGLVDWHAAGGGGGGGGALQIRAGGRVVVGTGAFLSARGGSGSDRNTSFASPGGGGSGGSLLIQAAGTFLLAGALDVRGGAGGRLLDASEGLELVGGEGGAGLCRVETDPRLPVGALAGLLPAPGEESLGLLQEKDPLTSGLSRVYSTEALAPRYLRYELEVQEGFLRRVYSDDPSVGIVPVRGLTPAGIAFQGVHLDGQGRPVGSAPWRASPTGFAAAAEVAPRALRFAIWLDSAQLGAGSPLEVLSLRVLYQP